MLTGFDHVTIAVRSIEVAVATYEALLGRPPSWRGEHPSLGTDGALFALSNAALELVSPKPEAAESAGLRARLEAEGEGLLALAFCVADAGLASRTLREKGLRVTPPEEGQARSREGAVRSYRTVELSQRMTRGISVYLVERASLADLRATDAASRAAADALDHVVLRTSDPAATSALYGQGLGLRLALDTVINGTRTLFFRTGGVTLEVVCDPTLASQDAFYGLAHRVGDVDAARSSALNCFHRERRPYSASSAAWARIHSM
jgi:catechol 2,3-dioxygenase-like lactoylglutathione lyase family enzyme